MKAWIFVSVLLGLFALRVTSHRVQYHITLYRVAKRHGCKKPYRLPSKDLIFGLDTVLQSLRLLKENRRMKAIFSQTQTYGHTFESWPFGRRVISTIEPRNIQSVLSLEHEKFGVAPVRELAQTPLTGRGIITSDGDVWAHARSMIRPTFTRAQIADRETFDVHLERLMNLLPTNGATVDLQPLFDRLILDASSEFIFGESFGSLLPDCPIDSKRFLDCFSYAQKGVGKRVLLGKMSFLIRDQRFWDSCKTVHEYTQRHIDRAIALHDKREEGKYVLVYELAKETDDRSVLCSQLLNTFFAGRDTPAVALTNVFFCLARHPHVWTRLREEVAGLEPQSLTFERLKGVRYLQYVINEALRLYPPVANQSRGCTKASILPTGGGRSGSAPIYVLPGDSISINFYSLHRNPEIFSPDPEAFRPERWQTIRPTWEFLPFGGGARHCPAQQLALFWVSYTLARIAQRYGELENRDDVETFVENMKLNMESLNGAKVGMLPA